MTRWLLWILSTLLSVSLAMAISVQTDEQEYSSGDIVLITIGGCAGDALVKVLNPTSDLIDVKDGNAVDYNTLSDRSKGKYTITASCVEGRMEENFCVDAPGCMGVAQVADAGAVAPQGATPAAPSAAGQAASGTTGGGGSGGGGGSRGGGGGGACQPHATLINRQCVCDAGYELKLNKCVPLDMVEDEEETMEEFEVPSYPSSSQLVRQAGAPSKQVAPRPTAAPVKEESFLGKYTSYVIAIPSILILLTVLIFGLMHFFPIRPVVVNVNELGAWIKAERQLGLTDEQIRQILRDRTTWKEKDIERAFGTA